MEINTQRWLPLKDTSNLKTFPPVRTPPCTHTYTYEPNPLSGDTHTNDIWLGRNLSFGRSFSTSSISSSQVEDRRRFNHCGGVQVSRSQAFTSVTPYHTNSSSSDQLLPTTAAILYHGLHHGQPYDVDDAVLIRRHLLHAHAHSRFGRGAAQGKFPSPPLLQVSTYICSNCIYICSNCICICF